MDKGPDEMKTRNLHEKLPQSFWKFNDKNAAEIQREIRTTRAELDETVHAIQNRLAPQEFINYFSDAARDVIRQGSPKVMQMIRNNPLPASLAAVGLGWLFIRSASGPQPQRLERGYGRHDTMLDDEYGLMSEGQYSATEKMDMAGGGVESSYEKGKEWTSEAAQRVKDKTSQWSEQAKDKASQLSGQAREKAGHFAEQARDKAGHLASQAREKASHMASDVMHKAGNVASQMADATRSKAGELAHSTMDLTSSVAHQAGEQARHLGSAAQGQLKRAGEGTQRKFQENPGAFALLCVGIGAALAMGLPTTRKEQELMGEKSESLKQQLKQSGQEALGKVENIMEAGRNAAVEEARKEDVI